MSNTKRDGYQELFGRLHQQKAQMQKANPSVTPSGEHRARTQTFTVFKQTETICELSSSDQR